MTHEIKKNNFLISNMAAVLSLLFISLTCWALSSPIGSSPDDDYHLTSIWCAESALNSDCARVANGIEVPSQLLISGCFAFDANVNGSCTEDFKPEDTIYAHTNSLEKFYPTGFYSTLSIFKSENKALFVFNARLFNALLFIIGLAILFFMAKDFDLWLKSLFIQVLSFIPLGFFLIPSTNPSSWSLIFLPALWIAMYTVGNRKEPHLAKSDVLSILFFWLCVNVARPDGALYTIIILISILIIFLGRKKQIHRNFYLVNFILIILSATRYLTSTTTEEITSKQVELNPGVSESFDSNLLWSNIQNITYYFTGSAGKTGLGWLDTIVPAFVWKSMTVVLATLLITGILLLVEQRNYRGLSSTFLLVTVYLAIPIVVLQINDFPVGEFVQPRYMLPLLVIIFLTALIQVRLSRNAFFSILMILSPVLWINFALSLGANIQRYSGIRQDPLNFFSYLNSYWSMFNIAPLNIFVFGVVSFGLFLFLLNYSYWNVYLRKVQQSVIQDSFLNSKND